MNFKIENNYLDITNYSTIEEHFADMANSGWLIKKVILGRIFIYKNIYPKDLDFIIIPYKVKTKDSEKIEEELEDFQSEYKNIGWNYASNSKKLYIFFREKTFEPIDLESNEKEEFKTIEKLAKRQLLSLYAFLTVFVLLMWLILSGFFSYASFIRNALIQVTILLAPIFIALSIVEIFRIKKFLKINRKNIEMGKKIEYSRSKFKIKKVFLFFYLILAAILIIYLIYVGVILKNSIVLFSILYVLILVLLYLIIEIISRIFHKNNRRSRVFETLVFIITIGLIPVVNMLYIPNLKILIEEYSDLDEEEFKVLATDKDVNEDRDEEERIYQNISLLVAKSYEYSYFDPDEKTYIDTEYSKTLNKDIAKKLVDVYKRDAKDNIKRHESNLEWAMESDNYYIVEEMFNETSEDFPREKTLKELGLTLEEFQEIDKNIIKKAGKEARKIIEDKAVREDEENLWNLEEVYFLSYDKTKVVIRVGKEVFYLEGKDFTDPETIKMAKDQLDL